MYQMHRWIVSLAVILACTLDASAFFKKPIAPEYHEMVCDWCARYLGRQADPVTIELLGRKLMRGDSPREVEAHVLGSKEYFLRNGSSNVGFIRGLHRDILGSEPVGGQLEYWLHKLNDLEFRDDLAESFLKNARKNVAALPPGPLPTVIPAPVPAYPAFPVGPAPAPGVDVRVNLGNFGPRVIVQSPPTQVQPPVVVPSYPPPPYTPPSYTPPQGSFPQYPTNPGALPVVRPEQNTIPVVPVETLPPPLSLPAPRPGA